MNLWAEAAVVGSDAPTSFWGVVAWAAGVSTAIATGVTLWLRQRDKPEPDWRVEISRTAQAQVDRTDRDFPDARLRSPYAVVTVTNQGDGYGHGVQVTGINCLAEFMAPPGAILSPPLTLPNVGPGDSFEVRAFHAGNLHGKKSLLRIEWTPAPTRVSSPVVEVIPLFEGPLADGAERDSDTIEWRYRELRWWQLLQRRGQWGARRRRKAAAMRHLQARTATREWLEAANPLLPEEEVAGRS